MSIVRESTPSDLFGKARLANGYPSITATVANTKVSVTTHENWFSYQTEDFFGENREIYGAIKTACWLYPELTVRFVGDAGLDDQRIFAPVEKQGGRFIIHACHIACKPVVFA